jgi:inorganic pyrophosphatase
MSYNVKMYNNEININKIKVKKNDDKLFFYYKDNKISPWHDLPYKKNENIYYMVNEIPKWTRKKMEINVENDYNPIIQDIENSKPREYVWGDMMFNYGAIPQTWEDPNHIYSSTNKKGDGDPIDIIEIGFKQRSVGEIVPIKILGVIPLIDDNETDWKMIAISDDDPLFNKIDNLNDLKQKMPGFLSATFTWFKKYKLPTKNKLNAFAFGEKAGDEKMAVKLIEQGHSHWKKLISNKEN